MKNSLYLDVSQGTVYVNRQEKVSGSAWSLARWDDNVALVLFEVKSTRILSFTLHRRDVLSLLLVELRQHSLVLTQLEN